MTVQTEQPDTESETPLYHRYAGDAYPQNAYLTLDLETGMLSAECWTNPGGGRSMRAHRGVQQLQFPVNAAIRRDALASVLERTQPYAQTILDHSVVEWQNDNLTGRVSERSDDARLAIEEICENLEPSEVGNMWQAGDWITAGGQQQAEDYLPSIVTATDREIATLAAMTCEEALRGDDVVIEGGAAALANYLRQRRDEISIGEAQSI
ncbi:MAG: hypothetical protein ACE5NA_00185 [Nitrospiraceae bacterium]